uniref:Uncharacterized protein n=1 Tax=Arundo donax TaxID=35708 RepID=A0A0A9EXQ4_ARUDO
MPPAGLSPAVRTRVRHPGEAQTSLFLRADTSYQ